ncbi:hypothetical protein CDD83_10424 [Cordyceps sp. RAO-2017]|nr:hypothetical protein CDD83_10424 [Cordyceps sp. RAO-2017]
MKFSVAILAAAVCLEQASATKAAVNWWTGQFDKSEPYPTPANVQNICSPDQQNGWNMQEDLKGRDGPVNNLHGYQVYGMTAAPANQPQKRSWIQARTFRQKKCLKAKCEQNVGQAPSIAGKKGSTIQKVELTCTVNGHVDLVFTMANGKLCRQSARCSGDRSASSLA